MTFLLCLFFPTAHTASKRRVNAPIGELKGLCLTSGRSWMHVEIISCGSPRHWKKFLLTPANAICRPYTNISNLVASVYLNLETVLTVAG